jgi:hypothetical protein
MYICQGYSDTLDLFAYIILYAPDFPADDDTTLDEEFDSLWHGINAVEARAHSGESLEFLRKCKEQVRHATSLYRDGILTEACKEMQRASESFQLSRRKNGVLTRRRSRE